MSDTSLVFNAVGRDRGVSRLLESTASNVRAANLRSAASTVALGAAMGSAASYAVALGSSVLQTVGALGLMPAAIAGMAATVVAGKAVTSGLGEAWKATGQQATGGGGAAVNVAKRVAMAQREVQGAAVALADAQRNALEAQAAITRARQEEAERLSDLSRSVAGARLDEESAARSVQKAERDLAAARLEGNPDSIKDADLAYRQSLQTLDEVRDRVDDLGKEQADGAAKGVEGSDAVQSALERQEQAQRAVTDAAQRLADAQDAVKEASAGAAGGGIDPAAEALARLAPSARAVVLTLRSLVPAWQAAGRAGQQATFAGVAGDLRDLSGIYLPMMTSWLQRMGGAFNVAIRNSLGMFQTKAAAADVGRVLGGTAGMVERLALAVRPLINGLLQWAAVGAGFLPGFGAGVQSVAEKFERWSLAARKSGDMKKWIGDAIGVIGQLGAIARDVGASVLAIFRAGDDGGSTLDALQRGAAALRRWTESADGQERLKAIFTSLRDVIGGLAGAFSSADGPRSTFTDGLSVAGPVLAFFADHTDLLAKALPFLVAGFLLSKSAQTAANITMVATVPLRVAETAATWALSRALRAHRTALLQSTVATGANTVASTAGDAATKRSLVSLAAQKVAMIATNVATKAAAIGQWLLNAAMAANPVGLIIIAIIALVAGIYLLWTRSSAFRDFFIGLWHGISSVVTGLATRWWALFTGFWGGVISAGRGAVRWIGDAVGNVVAWFTGIGGRLGRGLARIRDVVSAPFRAAFNWIARGWNNTVGRLSWQVPSWIPGIGGNSISAPKLPMLATGGTVARAGLAVVGEAGPEVVHLGAGASVIPLPKGGGSTGGTGGTGGTVRVVVVGGDRDAIAYFRRLIAQSGGL